MKAILWILGSLIVAGTIQAQVPRWVYRYDGHGSAGNDADSASSIVIGPDGNLYVAGLSNEGYSAEEGEWHYDDFTVISLTPSGAQRWAYMYNGAGLSHDGARSIIIGADGEPVAAGYSNEGGFWDDFMVVRLDASSGDYRWVYNSGMPHNDQAFAVTTDEEFNLYVAGYCTDSDPEGYSGHDWMVVSLYPHLPVERWQGPDFPYFTWDRAGKEDQARSIVAGSDGYVYVAGWSLKSETKRDITVAKIDAETGAPVGFPPYYYNGAGNDDDEAFSIVMGSDGNLYVAGFTHDDQSQKSKDFIVISLTTDMTQRWVSIYEGPGDGRDEAYSVIMGSDGNIYAVGRSDAVGATGVDFVVVSFEPLSGNQLWDYRYDGGVDGLDEAFSIVEGSDGNLYIAGYSTRTYQNFDFTVISLDKDGVLQCEYHYDHAGHMDKARSVVMGSDGNIYAAGFSSTRYQIGEEQYIDADFTVVSWPTACPDATAYPNGRKLCRVPGTDDLWISYQCNGVFAAFSPDGGEHFVDRWRLHEDGGFPTIDLTSPPGPGGGPLPFPVVVWQAPKENPTALWCTRFWQGQWDVQLLHTEFGKAPHLPSVVIDFSNHAHLTWETVDGNGIRRLNYATFQVDDPTQWPKDFQKDDPIDEVDGDGWVMAPCIDIDYISAPTCPRPNIVYKRGNAIYHVQKQGGVWTNADVISHPAQIASFPFAEVYGESLQALWHADGDQSPDEVWYRAYDLGYEDWQEIVPVSDWPDYESQYPCMAGSFASWSEERPPPAENWEIMMRERPFTGNPVNISNSFQRSMYSHVNYWQSAPTTHYLFSLWTEGDFPLYEVKVAKHPLNHPPVGYLYVDTGQEQPSFYCVARDSFIQFGPEAYQQVDIDTDQLIYRLPALMPWMRYQLKVTGYWEGGDEIQERLDMDGLDQRLIKLEPGVPETLTVWIPPAAYMDDKEVNVNITLLDGEWALTGPMILYEFEREEEGDGGSQVAATSSLEPKGLILSQNYPNPLQQQTTIRYQLPADSRLSLKIYDSAGRLVRTLLDDTEEIGYNTIEWDGKDNSGRMVANGIYFYRLDARQKDNGQTAAITLTNKMVVLR